MATSKMKSQESSQVDEARPRRLYGFRYGPPFEKNYRELFSASHFEVVNISAFQYLIKSLRMLDKSRDYRQIELKEKAIVSLYNQFSSGAHPGGYFRVSAAPKRDGDLFQVNQAVEHWMTIGDEIEAFIQGKELSYVFWWRGPLPMIPRIVQVGEGDKREYIPGPLLELLTCGAQIFERATGLTMDANLLDGLLNQILVDHYGYTFVHHHGYTLAKAGEGATLPQVFAIAGEAGIPRPPGQMQIQQFTSGRPTFGRETQAAMNILPNHNAGISRRAFVKTGVGYMLAAGGGTGATMKTAILADNLLKQVENHRVHILTEDLADVVVRKVLAAAREKGILPGHTFGIGGGTGATVNTAHAIRSRLLNQVPGNHHADIFTAPALVEAVERDQVLAAAGLEAPLHQLVQLLMTSGHTFGYGGAGNNIETWLGSQHAYTGASLRLLARHILAEASDGTTRAAGQLTDKGQVGEASPHTANNDDVAVVGGAGDAVAFQLNDDMLQEAAARATARARERGGSQGVDEDGGRFHAVDVDAPQQEQGDQGFVAAASRRTPRRRNGGRGDFAQRTLQSLLGGLVPLSLSFLHDACQDDCPKYIKLAAYTGLGVVTGFTFLGLISEKRANAAVRVAASTSIAAVIIGAVWLCTPSA